LSNYHVIGKTEQRLEGWAKVTGETRFTADMKLPGMLYSGVLRSKIPHARLLSIDTSEALSVPGVRAVLTAADIPGRNGVGIIVKDEPVLIRDRIRRVGDPLALVAADTREALDISLSRIRYKIKVLPAVFSAEEAMSDNAPTIHEKGNILLHRKIRHGNIEKALEKAEVIIENRYETPFVEHAYLEPEASMAQRTNDSITVWTSTQNPHFDRGEVASALGLEQNRVRIVQMPTGGGFGGKLDISTQCHTALLAWHTRRPVKLVYDREESFIASGKRHPYIIDYLTAADRQGKLVGVKVKIIANTGAYASYGPGVATRAAVHATGPYYVPNVHVDAYAVYTNNPYCGAMRGFGVPQIGFAHETQIDLLGEKVGLDAWQIRAKNFFRPGLITSTGQLLEQSLGIGETLNKVREKVNSLEKIKLD